MPYLVLCVGDRPDAPRPDSQRSEMNAEAGVKVIRIGFDELVTLLRSILERHGAPFAIADILARNCATAERDGAESHGVFRIPGYVATLESGYVTATATPVLEDASPALLRVDACNGFAVPALATARATALDKVRACGVAVVAIRDSHHFSALWIDVEPFAREGLVAATFVNGFSRIAPYSGHQRFYGTNPMALAVPRQSGDPLVFDQASSAMAYGDIRIAAREGRQVPPGTGLDRHHQPTTDPNAILDGGAILPFGGHKGSSISMMVELFAAALCGGSFSFEVNRDAYPTAETSRSGQLVLLIDPSRGAMRDYAARVDDLVAGLRGAGQSRLPGDRRYAHRRDAAQKGIPLPARTLADLQALCDGK